MGGHGGLLAVLVVTLVAHIAGFCPATQARLWVWRDETGGVEQHPEGQHIGEGMGDRDPEHRTGAPGDPAPEQAEDRSAADQRRPAAVEGHALAEEEWQMP